ncbi:MAG: arylsulfotransferase family protein, partial [Pseudomonadota bacterium]
AEQDILHRWVFNDAENLAFESDNPFIMAPDPRQSNTMRTVHPWLSEDGNLYAHVHFGAMYRFDACSDVDWVNAEFMYHHSLERDADGNFWSVGTTTTEAVEYGFDDRFQDNHVIQLNPEGEVIYNRSVLEIVIETGLFNLTYDYDVYQTDLIHLNDIQPVFEDSEIAKRGDVYLSLGHLNMAMLFRPATDKVVWWSQSYMKHQHDIDIIGPDTIQIFDNRRRTGPDRNAITLGPNEMLRFELPDTNAKRFFLDPMKALDVRTKSQGLADTIPGSGIVMEDTNSGRLVKFDEAGEAEWTYLNRSEDGRVWTLNWSRYLPEQAAVAALEQLGKVSCQD